MHSLWVQVIQEVMFLIVQAVIVTVTFLLHRITKKVGQMMNAHLLSLEHAIENLNLEANRRP